jgi:hypothetical protein
VIALPGTVSLTAAELFQAAFVGAFRRIDSISQSRTPTAGAPAEDAWTVDIEGACAELAFAKAASL